MRTSIKYQFAAVIATLVVGLLAGTATFLIYQKSAEMTQDIFQETYNFAQFTSDDLMDNFQENFMLARSPQKFESRLNEILNLSQAVDGLQVASYAGQLFFDSAERADMQLDSAVEVVDPDFLERIKARNVSVLTEEGRIVYLKQNEEGKFIFVDENEDTVEALKANTRIVNLVLPYRDDEHTLIFDVSYADLDARIVSTAMGILAFLGIGLLVALGVGFFLAGRVTAPLSRLAKHVGTLQTEGRKKVKVKSQNEIGQLAESFNKMIDDLEQYEEELVDQERLETELRLAADIQNSLIPKEIPQAKGLEVAAAIYPAAEIGGDCYDFFPEEGNLLYYIGDVTGHGVPSGLVVSIANALFYYFTQETDSTVELLSSVNKVLKPKTKPNMFLTAMAARWDEVKGKLHYASAGHEPPLYCAVAEEVRELEAGGMALGMLPDISKLLKEYEVKMAEGDVMVMYTDGIPEAWGPAKGAKAAETEGHDFYGMERFKDSVQKHTWAGKSAQEIVDGILADVRSFMQGIPAQDDITLVVVKRIKSK